MANYSAIKAAVNAYIKQNGKKEITGHILNSVLNATIDSLGKEFQFGGVLTPANDPGRPDQNVAYIGAAGTYPNFDGLVIASGTIGIFMWNGDWSFATIPVGKDYDNDIQSLTHGLQELYENIQELSDDVIHLDGINEEDLSIPDGGKLHFANRVYNAQQPNGMGYKILRKDATLASQVTDENTIYEIRYNFAIGETAVPIPAGCVLKFAGGSLSNGTIYGQRTRIDADVVKIFDSVSFSGSWDVSESFPQWFGAIADNTTDNTSAFQAALNAVGVLSNQIHIIPGLYRFDGTLTIWKSNTNVNADDGVNLRYYGKSNFIVIDLTDGVSHYNAARGSFVGSTIRAYDVDCEDIFHLVYAPQYRFERIITQYGKNGFNTVHSNFAGIWYTYFIECVAQWAKENGFNIRANTGQVNQVSFYRCSAGSCGNPIYGQSTGVQDTVNGNGFDISGTAITVMSCSSEINNGCGIKIRKDAPTASGIVIVNTYCERNLYYPVYIGTGRNIFATSLYDRENGNIVCDFSQLESNGRNIFVPEDVTKRQRGFVSPSKSAYLVAKPYRDVNSAVTGLLLPAKFRYKLRANTGASYFVLSLGLVYAGNLLRVSTELRTNFDNVEARTITDISNNVVTVDSTLTAQRKNICLIAQEHPLYSLGQSVLTTYPTPVDLLISNGNYVAVRYGVTVNAGENKFTLTSAMLANYPSLKVGDVVYFFNSPEYTTLHTIGVSNTAERTPDVQLPTTLAGHPLAKSFCCMFTTNMGSDVIPFDFIGGYTVE